MTPRARSWLLALAVVAAGGCGGDGTHETAALAPEPAVTSQDRLPDVAESVESEARRASEAERSHQACRAQIAQSCIQASLRSEAICRLARCESVAGLWVLRIPHEEVEQDLRRRGY